MIQLERQSNIMSHSTPQHVTNTKQGSTATQGPSNEKESKENITAKHSISDPSTGMEDPLISPWEYPEDETMEYAPGLSTSLHKSGCGMSWKLFAPPTGSFANNHEGYMVTGKSACSGCSELGCRAGERFGCNCEYGCGCGCTYGRRSTVGWTNTPR